MSDIHLPTLLVAAFPGLSLLALVNRSWTRKVRALEQDLRSLSAALRRMNEAHLRSSEQLAGNLADVEERLTDLAVPSGDPELPLERRHRVLSLAKQGVPVDQISKTLNVPRCEAELVLSLQTFAGAPALVTRKPRGDSRRHAQAQL